VATVLIASPCEGFNAWDNESWQLYCQVSSLPQNWSQFTSQLGDRSQSVSGPVILWKILIPSNSDILYSTFISGDGNFHMQLQESKPTLERDPSYFGDTGFWAVQAVFDGYLKNSNAPSVRSASTAVRNDLLYCEHTKRPIVMEGGARMQYSGRDSKQSTTRNQTSRHWCLCHVL
jgi:hypothetical protein